MKNQAKNSSQRIFRKQQRKILPGCDSFIFNLSSTLAAHQSFFPIDGEYKNLRPWKGRNSQLEKWQRVRSKHDAVENLNFRVEF